MTPQRVESVNCMDQNPEIEEVPDQQESSLNRREFLRRAAALGLSAGALALFEAACSSVEPLSGLSTMEPSAPAPPTPGAAANAVSAPPQNSIPTTAPPVTTQPRSTPKPGAGAAPFTGSQGIVTATPPPSAAPGSQTVGLPTGTPEPAATPAQVPLPVVRQVPLSDKRLQIGHLLRRAGFGAAPEEFERFVSMGVADSVDYLIEYQQVDDSALETRLEGLGFDLEKLGHLQRWALLRMIYTKRPLQEKMVLFWHGLLTSAFKKVGGGPYMLNQDHLFREQALGPYDVLLKAVSRDPAMLIWLDSRVNKKTAPNENFARELMELFSMGPGPYSEKDVRESARAFTGSRLRQKVFEFDATLHDNGVKTFLNSTGHFDGDQIIDIILDHPQTGKFMGSKLFSFFAYDDPEEAVVSRLASIFRTGDFSIKKVVREILTSKEFYSDKAYRSQIKSPPELVAGAVRSLGMESDGSGLNGITNRMGMNLFNPFDVSGWPGGAAWINSTTLLQRINFANRISTARRGRLKLDLPSLTAGRGIFSAKEGLTYLVALLLDGNIPQEDHDVLFSFARSLDNVNPGGTPEYQAKELDEKLRALVYLILASPDYQLA